MKTLKLQELNEPNLLEGLFPHVAPPRIDFAEMISEQLEGDTYTLNPSDVKTRQTIFE